MKTPTPHTRRPSRVRRALIAIAAICGAVVVVPLATGSPASAQMSSCHVNNVGNYGAYSWCDSGDSNDRQRANVYCSNGVGMRYGPVRGVFYSSQANCPSGSTRQTRGVQVCDTYYQSPTLSYCQSGWYQREHS